MALNYFWMCLFLTPYCDQYFLVHGAFSICFSLEIWVVNRLNTYETTPTHVYILGWIFLMSISTYSLRRMLVKFFLMQTEAEQTRDALTLILDNLPDAVLMIDGG